MFEVCAWYVIIKSFINGKKYIYITENRKLLLRSGDRFDGFNDIWLTVVYCLIMF